MASNRAEVSIARILRHEGGFVNHPKDPGKATNKGITIATYRRYIKASGTVADLKALTTEQAVKVYRYQYWNAVRGDDLPAGLDYAVADFAVNSGPSRAIKYLQNVLSVKADGVMGPVTIAAAQKARPIIAINLLCDDRLAFLKRLRTWGTFGRGWQRRVDEVRRDAVADASAAPVESTPAKPAQQHWLSALIAAILGVFRK
ncbi:glycoside hydrolase family 108 protein [Sulfitobacter sp. 1A12157]|uniref:glycoside hydrolase family 108 protein n=1 Tax=Sulfitobacter sp. 1A12157 TaxID=3368594 RepID=UPI003744ED2E